MSLDLRDWLRSVEQMGELKSIEGASWNEEIGAITDLIQRSGGPAILFDSIEGYPPGYRVLANSTGSTSRLALTLGLKEVQISEKEFIKKWREKTRNLFGRPPVEVNSGPILENVFEGASVNLFNFPAPKWHYRDGGRYLGTGVSNITCDPGSGKVNIGTYRMMIVDHNHLVGWMIPGKDGYLHREKYFKEGQKCPIAISFGHHPIFSLIGGQPVPQEFDEYEYIGAIYGEAVQVIRGAVTGLPIPAFSEIAIEGYILPDQVAVEGPFGEWTGYYGSPAKPEPVIEVQAVYHRDNPIILGMPPCKPPSERDRSYRLLRALAVEDYLAKAGVPGVTGAWYLSPGATRFLLVIGIQQKYPGHARQAAMAALGSKAAGFMGRFIIVVDDDVDITDLNDVMWAVCTRANPKRSIAVIDRCWSSAMDPAIHGEEVTLNSQCIIDACWPFEWKSRPETCSAPSEYLEATKRKWNL